MSAFESVPFDGQHTWAAGNDWRGGTGILDSAKRYLSYGNYAGQGNRILEENKEHVARQRQLDPNYNENRDPLFLNDPRYAPIDGIDAAAKVHDTGYPDHLRGNNMFSWEGMHAVREDDRRLVDDVGTEVASNGSKYSKGALNVAAGTQGFFGGRVMAMDALDWAGSRAHEAGAGVSGFVEGASKWGSLGDAAQGIGRGVSSAGSWLAKTGNEAVEGTSSAASRVGALGATGVATTALGMTNVALAGVGHLASGAWNGIADSGKRLASGAADVFGHFAD